MDELGLLYDRRKSAWLPLSDGSVVRPGELIRWRRSIIEDLYGPLLPLDLATPERAIVLGEGRAIENALKELLK